MSAVRADSRRSMKSQLAAFTGLLVLVGSLVATAPRARADGAALVFSPQNGSFATGKSFSVDVSVNSGGGAGINAAQGVIGFDPSIATVASVSKTGSVFSLWTADPSYSNTDGTITFSGGSPSAYTGSGGKVLTITFNTVKTGSLSLNFTTSSVLAADGQGTDVLSTVGTGSYTVETSATPPPAAPADQASDNSTAASAPAAGGAGQLDLSAPGGAIQITSPTHPDPETWYSNNSPEFDWQLDPLVTDVSFALTAKPTSDPGKTSAGLVASKKFDNVDDGTWYFHIRFKDQTGAWSPPLHRKVLIDTTPPNAFGLQVRKDDGTGRPLLMFATDDKGSGIDHYEVLIDNASVATLTPEALQAGPYRVAALLPGAHTATVKAFDRAGNNAEATQQFNIDGIGAAKITSMPSSIVQGSELVIEGIADPMSKVTVRTSQGSKVISEDETSADENGKWVLVTGRSLDKGTYDISVKMFTSIGAQSDYGDKLPLSVIARPLFERFGLAALIVTLFVIGGLLLAFFLYRRAVRTLHERAHREAQDARQKTQAVFAALREEAEEKIALLDERMAVATGATQLTPDYVLDQLREAIDISETAIDKEIQDVGKMLDT